MVVLQKDSTQVEIVLNDEHITDTLATAIETTLNAIAKPPHMGRKVDPSEQATAA
jgi:hypothetical protein